MRPIGNLFLSLEILEMLKYIKVIFLHNFLRLQKDYGVKNVTCTNNFEGNVKDLHRN